MLGHKVRDFKPLMAICGEDLVPTDNFYRQVNIEGVMVAAGQNLKRLIKHDARKPFFVFSKSLLNV